MTLIEKLCGSMNGIECYNSITAVTSMNAFWYSYLTAVIAVALLLLVLGFVGIKVQGGRKILFTRPAYWYVGWLPFLLFNGLLYFFVVNPQLLRYI